MIDYKPRLISTDHVKSDGTDVMGTFDNSIESLPAGVGTSPEALRESEAQYRMLVDSIQGYAIFMLNPQGLVVSWNAGAERIKGYTSQEIIGHNFSCFFPPDDIKKGRPGDVLRMTAAKGSHEEQGMRVRKDGSRFLANVTLTALHDRGGNLRGFSEISRDLSERVEAAKYRGLLESAPDAMVVVNQGGEIVLLNAQAEKQFGYHRDELLGQTVKNIIPVDFAERLIADGMQTAADALAQQIVTGIELSGRRKDGSEFPIEIMLSPLKSAEGILVTAAIRDISARKNAENYLAQMEARYGDLLEAAPDAMVVVNQGGGIVLLNAQAEKQFGYHRDELLGQTVKNIIPVDFAERLIADGVQTAADALAQQIVTGMELSGRRKDGSEFPIEIMLSPLKNADGILVTAAIRDISVRKSAAKDLALALARAKEANLAKSEFLAAMSHEIRTPMNAILGMSDMLAESPLDPEQMQYVDVFRRAGANLLVLINDILDLSKIEAGHLELEHVDFDLEEVIDQAIELTSTKSHAKGVVLMSSLSPSLPTTLVGDPARLRQILINLLGNAVKFTNAGEVLLRVQNHESGQAGEVEFSVSDTGIGIPPDKLETIFDIFTQADSSISRQYGGTGLGLRISRHLVERMGGSLTVTSRVGEGSTFRFNARFEQRDNVERKARVEMTDFQGRRILVIDDNATNRFILGETLSAWGIESHEFGAPLEALANLSAAIHSDRPYSLVLVDRVMPGMDGFEIAARIKRLAPELPVVMFTSDVMPGDIRRRREVELSGYAVKPVKRSELLHLICRAMHLPEELRAQGILDCVKPTTIPLNLLIAEDSEDNRLLVQFYLKGSSHRLTFAENGKAALDQFERGSFDLILMDMQMPVMDGLTAARAMRGVEQERRTSAVPIIALTANARREDVELSASAGCNYHLSKPFTKRKLLSVIEEYGASLTPVDKPDGEPSQSIWIEMPPGLEEIVPGYLAARRRKVPEMMALLAASNFAPLAVLGHDLKGTGASYGFAELTHIGAELERFAKQMDCGALVTQLNDLDDYLSRVILVSAERSLNLN